MHTIVYTDNVRFAQQYLPEGLNWRIGSPEQQDENVEILAGKLFSSEKIYQATLKTDYLWQDIFFVEHATESQFDVLVDLAQQNVALPHGVLCLAGSGEKFHGLRNRSWMSPAGNIHLSVFLTPQQAIEHFGVGFTILAAVSVLQALDSINGLADKAMVKWVNDILIENAKVCGVLAHVQTQEKIVTAAIVGIGLNVETTPPVAPTPYVPKVAALDDFVRDRTRCNQAIIFQRLIHFLDRNYQRLAAGHFAELLEVYRKRSLIVGKTVQVFSDAPNEESTEMVHGKVESIGENLELIFAGTDSAVSKGRLVLRS